MADVTPTSRFASRQSPEEMRVAAEAALEKAINNARYEFDRYLAAVPARSMRVMGMEWVQGSFDEAEKQAFYLGRQDRDEKPPLIPVAEVREKYIPIMCSLAQQKPALNFYYTPYSERHNIVLFDDVNGERLHKLQEFGYRPALTMASSRDNYQVIGVVETQGVDPEINRRAANKLIREVNGVWGDPKISGCFRPHRAPGFFNAKPAHRASDQVNGGRGPMVSTMYNPGGYCAKLQSDFERLVKVARDDVYWDTKAEQRQSIGEYKVRVDPEMAFRAYEAHANQLAAKFGGWEDEDLDRSLVMHGAIQRMMVTGWDHGAIEQAGDRFCREQKRREDEQRQREIRQRLREGDPTPVEPAAHRRGGYTSDVGRTILRLETDEVELGKIRGLQDGRQWFYDNWLNLEKKAGARGYVVVNAESQRGAGQEIPQVGYRRPSFGPAGLTFARPVQPEAPAVEPAQELASQAVAERNQAQQEQGRELDKQAAVEEVQPVQQELQQAVAAPRSCRPSNPPRPLTLICSRGWTRCRTCRSGGRSTPPRPPSSRVRPRKPMTPPIRRWLLRISAISPGPTIWRRRWTSRPTSRWP